MGPCGAWGPSPAPSAPEAHCPTVLHWDCMSGWDGGRSYPERELPRYVFCMGKTRVDTRTRNKCVPQEARIFIFENDLAFMLILCSCRALSALKSVQSKYNVFIYYWIVMVKWLSFRSTQRCPSWETMLSSVYLSYLPCYHWSPWRPVFTCSTVPGVQCSVEQPFELKA
jgi:hypothetical protein